MPRTPDTFRAKPREPSSHGKRMRGSSLMKRRQQVFNRDKWRCQNCGSYGTSQSLIADHRKPLFRGGLDNISNMQTLCVPCHDAKTKSERR